MRTEKRMCSVMRERESGSREILIKGTRKPVNCLSSCSTQGCCDPILSSCPISCCPYQRYCSSSSGNCGLTANDYYCPPISTITTPKCINSYQTPCTTTFPLTKTTTKCKNCKICNKGGRTKCGCSGKKLKTKCGRRFNNKCRNCGSYATTGGNDLELLLGSSCCYPSTGYSPCSSCSGYSPCSSCSGYSPCSACSGYSPCSTCSGYSPYSSCPGYSPYSTCSGYSPCDLSYSGYYPCYSAGSSYPCCLSSYCSY
ncbi:hypothetical protein O3M35_003658 [Rhynocoris fuscipes]|uniref:Uncharacterized protein n=1 Tax=Rhynocoris fuscipes TaxID=488301 RepID=A0AAW1CL42_9HEMI